MPNETVLPRDAVDPAGRSGNRRAGASLFARGGALLALATLAGPARGEGAELRLSLRDAVARALSDGTAARIAAERVDLSRAVAGQARSEVLPQVALEVQDSNEVINLKTFGLTLPGVNPIVGPFNVFDAHVRLAARIVDIAAYRRYKAAKQGVAVADAERRLAENEVAAAVATLYVALQRARANVEATRANVELFTKLRDLAEDQRKAGVATRLDSTRAEVALAGQRQTLLVDENQSESARLALLHAVGADQTLDLVLTDPVLEPGGAPGSVEQALESARRDRPELLNLDEQLRAAEMTIAAGRAQRYPALEAQFQGGYNGNYLGDLAWNRSVGATLAVPVFTGGRISAQIAEAESRERELKLQHVETERQIEEEVRRAFLNLESARNRVAVAEENVRLAGEELEFAQDRFRNGVTSSIEVDNAQSSYAAARAGRIAAQADQAQARFDLERATGRIRRWIEVREPQ